MKDIMELSHVYSYTKLLRYIASFAANNYLLEVDGESYSMPRLGQLDISDKFFTAWSCDRCGRCCKAWDIIYTEEGISRIASKGRTEQIGAFNEIVIKVNGVDKIIYSQPSPKIGQGCCRYKSGDESGSTCLIHNCRPIASMVPHITIRHIGNKSYLRKQPYPRNHLMKCRSVCKPFDMEEFITDIETLNFINTSANDLGIITHIPDIIKLLKKCVETNNIYKHVNFIPEAKKLF